MNTLTIVTEIELPDPEPKPITKITATIVMADGTVRQHALPADDADLTVRSLDGTFIYGPEEYTSFTITRQ